MMEVRQILNSVLFQGMKENEIEGLLKFLKAAKKTYQKGETIFHMGECVTKMGIIVKGSVYIIRGDAWGNENILDHAGCGQVFGETYACTRGEPLTVDVVAAEDAEIIFIDSSGILEGFDPSCASHVRLLQNLVQVMAQKNLAFSRKMSHIMPKTIRERLLSYLSYEAVKHQDREFDIPFNRQQMADYLLVERSALSKELSRMREEGLLSYRKNHFILHEME